MAGSALVGDIAGIYARRHAHSHRRRGAGASAVSAAIDYELRAGAVVLPALRDNAEPFFEGLGFVAVDHASTWVLPAE